MAARKAIVFIFAFLLLTAAPGAAAALDNAAGRLLSLINEYRSTHGLAPLAADTVLSGVARDHGEDMTARAYFAHVTPEGGDLGHRLWNAGYRFFVAAENLARGYRDAAAVLDGWHGSTGHQANLLRDDVSHAGVAVIDPVAGSGAEESGRRDAGPVWVLVLARPRTH
ncbi:MAG: CAP domain-containing protein [Alphaproteobacteria bacterium]